jgi:4-oxalocrotonate tautomerase
MPIINVKLPGPVFTAEQKLQLVSRLTDTFVDVLGEQVRPFTFVVIEETKQNEWGIAGRPMPDPQWLISDEYKSIYQKAEQTIRGFLDAQEQGS